MGNKTHQLEPATFRAVELVNLVERLAQRDGYICPDEQRGIELARAIREDITREVATDNLIAHIQKGVVVSRYTNQLAAPLGVQLVAMSAVLMEEEEPLDAA